MSSVVCVVLCCVWRLVSLAPFLKLCYLQIFLKFIAGFLNYLIGVPINLVKFFVLFARAFQSCTHKRLDLNPEDPKPWVCGWKICPKLISPIRLLTNFQSFLLSFLRHWSPILKRMCWQLKKSKNFDFSKKRGGELKIKKNYILESSYSKQ